MNDPPTIRGNCIYDTMAVGRALLLHLSVFSARASLVSFPDKQSTCNDQVKSALSFLMIYDP